MRNQRHPALQRSAYVSAGSNSFGKSLPLPVYHAPSSLPASTCCCCAWSSSPFSLSLRYLLLRIAPPPSALLLRTRELRRERTLARTSASSSTPELRRWQSPPRTRDPQRASHCRPPHARSATSGRMLHAGLQRPPSGHPPFRPLVRPASSSTKPSSSPILLPTS